MWISIAAEVIETFCGLPSQGRMFGPKALAEGEELESNTLRS